MRPLSQRLNLQGSCLAQSAVEFPALAAKCDRSPAFCFMRPPFGPAALGLAAHGPALSELRACWFKLSETQTFHRRREQTACCRLTKRGCLSFLNPGHLGSAHERKSSEGRWSAGCQSRSRLRKRGNAGGSMLINLAGGMAARKTLLRRAETGATPVALKILAVAAIGMTAASCSAPQRIASSNRRTIDPKYGVVASPRVVGENDPVPKGGGREMVGKPVCRRRAHLRPPREPKRLRARGAGVLVRNRLPRPVDRKRRNLRPLLDRRSASDPAAAELRPGHECPEQALDHRSGERPGPLSRQPPHGRFAAGGRGARFQARRHNSRARRVRRSRLDARQRRQQASSDVANRWAACALSGQASIMVADAGEAASPPAWSPVSPHEIYASRSGESDSAPAAIPAQAATPSLAAAQPRAVVRTALAATLVEEEASAPAERVVVDAPLPPERPLDLGPIRSAATSVPATSATIAPPAVDALPPRRPAYANLAAPGRAVR